MDIVCIRNDCGRRRRRSSNGGGRGGGGGGGATSWYRVLCSYFASHHLRPCSLGQRSSILRPTLATSMTITTVPVFGYVRCRRGIAHCPGLKGRQQYLWLKTQRRQRRRRSRLRRSRHSCVPCHGPNLRRAASFYSAPSDCAAMRSFLINQRIVLLRASKQASVLISAAIASPRAHPPPLAGCASRLLAFSLFFFFPLPAARN